MIVDDETIIRKGLAKMLQRIVPNWEINAQSRNGMDAIETVQREHIDIIISDIRMPIMDGLEMVKHLSDQAIDIPVVFLTGYDEFQYVQQALRLHAFDYLLKPVKDEDMQRILTRFMKEKYVPVGQSMSNDIRLQLQKFEFELLCTLEAYNTSHLIEVLQKGAALISEQYNVHSFINEVIRITNTFFTKNGIYGLNYLVSSSNISNHIDSLSRTISTHLDRMKEHKQSSGHDKIIQKAMEYIKDNLSKQLTLSMVASNVHLNPTYFSEYFKIKTGENFTSYLTRMRMEEAKRLLANPCLKINEIAACLGYSDPRYFSKTFKEVIGILPKEYKEQSDNME
jgi:two-component system response regulator YesN